MFKAERDGVARAGATPAETDRFATAATIGCEPAPVRGSWLGPTASPSAAVLAGALSLAACSSSGAVAAHLPAALFLDGAEQTAVYTPGAGAAPPDQLRYLAALSDLSSACRYVDEASKWT